MSDAVLGTRAGDAGAVRLYLSWCAAILLVFVVVGVPLGFVARTNTDLWLFDGSFGHDLMLLFHLDAEGGVGAAASAGAMVAAAVWGWRWAAATRATSGRVFAAIMIFLALDDWLEVHERVEAKTGVDWQALYLPVGLVAVVVFLLIDRRLPRDVGRARWSWRSGAVLQAVALVLEFVQWDGDDQPVAWYPFLMVVEEIFEFLAPAAWGLALLAAFMIRFPRVVEPLRVVADPEAAAVEPSALAWFEPTEPALDGPRRASNPPAAGASESRTE